MFFTSITHVGSLPYKDDRQMRHAGCGCASPVGKGQLPLPGGQRRFPLLPAFLQGLPLSSQDSKELQEERGLHGHPAPLLCSESLQVFPWTPWAVAMSAGFTLRDTFKISSCKNRYCTRSLRDQQWCFPAANKVHSCLGGRWCCDEQLSPYPYPHCLSLLPLQNNSPQFQAGNNLQGQIISIIRTKITCLSADSQY